MANSNTSVKERQQVQPPAEDLEAARVIQQIRATGQPVKEHSDVGRWSLQIEELNAAALSGEIDNVLKSITEAYPPLNRILAFSPEAEQEQTDYRLTRGKNGKPVFITLSMDDIDMLPGPEWLIKRVLAKRTTSLFFAPSGTGKTFEALDFALHLAYGFPWQGRKVQQCSVLYIYGEGRNGLKLRKNAWQIYYGNIYNNGKPLPNHPNFRAIAHPVQLIGDKELILNTLEALPNIPDLVIIDTFSVCALDTDENSNPQVAKALSVGTDIRDKYGSHFMVIHHTGNENLDKWRGAASFKGNVDAVMYLSQEDKQGPIFLKCDKQRDGTEPFDPIKLQLEKVHLGYDEDGDEITSCVIVPSSIATVSENRSTLVQAHMVRVLEVEGTLKTSQFRTSVTKDKDLGISRNEYYDGITALEDASKIEVVVNGVRVEGKTNIKAAKNSGKAVFYRLPTTHTTHTDPCINQVVQA